MNPLNSNSPINNFNQSPFNNQPTGQNQFINQNQSNSQDQLMMGVRKAKEFMQMTNGNPAALLQRFPELKPFMQGQNLESVFTSMCQASGIDPNVIINELRS